MTRETLAEWKKRKKAEAMLTVANRNQYYSGNNTFFVVKLWEERCALLEALREHIRWEAEEPLEIGGPTVEQAEEYMEMITVSIDAIAKAEGISEDQGNH